MDEFDSSWVEESSDSLLVMHGCDVVGMCETIWVDERTVRGRKGGQGGIEFGNWKDGGTLVHESPPEAIRWPMAMAARLRGEA